MNRVFLAIFIIVSFAGFLDSLYLTVYHYRNLTPTCFILNGCERVLTSPYAVLFLGAPNALYGVLYYGAIFALAVFGLNNFSRFKQTAILVLVSLGFLVHIYFVYLQWFVIGAWCFYCLLSALFTAVLFGLSLGWRLLHYR